MHCKIWDEKVVWFFDLESDCEKCLSVVNKELEQINCPLYEDVCRLGISIAHKKNIFLCCSKSECKNNKRFIEKFSIIKSEIPFLVSFISRIESKYAQIEREKYSQIVHNLKSLNAQSIATQSLFIPQNPNLSYRSLFDIVEEKVQLEPREATLTLLKLAKNNYHIKTEFTTHEKLSFENPVLFKQSHNIKAVILNVYHSFDIEFREKHLELHIDNKDVIIYFDFDTIRVALYHMFSNAIKYMKPYTILDVSFIVDEINVDVNFKMSSFYIQPSERSSIFNDHYSGVEAVANKLNGNGLGLGYIKKALGLNNGEFIIHAGDKIETRNKIKYSENIFVFRFNNVDKHL